MESIFNHSLAHRRLVYGHISDPKDGTVVDEVMVAYMKAPQSYTREDVVEIYGHGGPLPLQRTLETVLGCGARMANPGEFTLRAFLNGRIDLVQAEAVLDVIQAKTEAALRMAMNGVGGRLSEPLKALRGELMSILAHLTARIDFPEDDVPPEDVLEPLRQARTALDQLIVSADAGIIYRYGVRTAIVGRPNVGKSSLLNRLLGQSRAIVTPTPGTTRDTLEEVVNIKGIPFVLVDTAGLAETKDVVEHLGVERTRRAMEQADLLLMVLDTSELLTSTDREIAALLKGRQVVMVANKGDLPRQAPLEELPWKPIIASALTGEGMEAVEQEMVQTVLGGSVVSSDGLMVSNPRHKAALQRAQEHLAQSEKSLLAQMPDDFVTIDLTAALNALGEITGETVTEELLDIIFSKFCIGK